MPISTMPAEINATVWRKDDDDRSSVGEAGVDEAGGRKKSGTMCQRSQSHITQIQMISTDEKRGIETFELKIPVEEVQSIKQKSSFSGSGNLRKCV